MSKMTSAATSTNFAAVALHDQLPIAVSVRVVDCMTTPQLVAIPAKRKHKRLNDDDESESTRIVGQHYSFDKFVSPTRTKGGTQDSSQTKHL
jgi:hypothetical protein